jgi:hypothetical protein
MTSATSHDGAAISQHSSACRLKHLEEWKLDEIAEELSTNISASQALFRGVKNCACR